MHSQENLSRVELESYRGQGGGIRTGKYFRYYCPIHGSDKQRSLQLNPDNGHFRCYACGAWGYLDEFKDEWIKKQKNDGYSFRTRKIFTSINTIPKKVKKETIKSEYTKALKDFQEFLPGSWGEEYLRRRKIPLKVAYNFGVGYSPSGKWLHKGRDWKFGRLVFPHTDLSGEIINLYGRAVGSDKKVPKGIRHDHLPGAKGVFNSSALEEDSVFICEGVFDALSMISAGHKNTCAIFGINGLCWEWVKSNRMVFCLDNDSAGSKTMNQLCWEGSIRGKDIYFLPEKTYRGYKDLNELWVAEGEINIGDWD